MKKIFYVLAVAALCASCAKSDKCKCSVEVNLGDIKGEAKELIVDKPEDVKCSEIKVDDIKGELGSLNLSKAVTVKCKNYKE